MLACGIQGNWGTYKDVKIPESGHTYIKIENSTI